MVPCRSFRILALIAFALSAPSAWAVVGNVDVTITDPAGKPVPGATISLTTPAGAAVTATTNSEGQAVLRDVEEGSHLVTISGPDVRRTRRRLIVVGGQSTQATLIAPRLLAEAPSGCLGCLAVGPTAMLDSVSDLPITVNRSTITNEAQGRTPQTTTTDHDLAESNRDFDHRSRIDTAGLEVSFGVRGQGGVAAFRGMGLGPATGLRPAMAVGSGSTTGGASPRFHPALVVAVGRASAELEFENQASPGDSVVFEGSGLVLGAGVDATWFLGDGGWYTGAGYRYQRLLESGVARRRPLVVEGGRLTADDFKLRHQAHTAHARVGYGTRNVAPWAGVRAVFRKIALDGDFRFDFSQRFGFPVSSRFVARNEFEENVVQAMAGIDFRLPRTRLFARAEAGFGGGNNSAGVRLAYGLGF